MPFKPGRKKTGGRTKGGSLKTSRRFIDQLQRYGLNVARELAHGVMAIQDPIVRFNEIRRILPYLLPELKPIEMKELEDASEESGSSISDADLLGALENNGRSKQAKQDTSSVPAVEARNPAVQAPSRPEEDLSEMDGIEEPD
jgi:hypothetical protein